MSRPLPAEVWEMFDLLKCFNLIYMSKNYVTFCHVRGPAGEYDSAAAALKPEQDVV